MQRPLLRANLGSQLTAGFRLAVLSKFGIFSNLSVGEMLLSRDNQNDGASPRLRTFSFESGTAAAWLFDSLIACLKPAHFAQPVTGTHVSVSVPAWRPSVAITGLRPVSELNYWVHGTYDGPVGATNSFIGLSMKRTP
jgi:hypothetical protein